MLLTWPPVLVCGRLGDPEAMLKQPTTRDHVSVEEFTRHGRVSLFTPPPFETGVCDRLAARCGIRAASRDRGPCPPCPDAPPTAPRSRLRVRPADRLSLPPAKPVYAASSCMTRPRCGVEATPLDAVWHGNPHGRARTAQPRRLEERRARTGDMGCASYPPARCAARYRTSAGTVKLYTLTG